MAFDICSPLAGLAMLTLLSLSSALAASTRPLFDLDSPATAPFASDRFTVPDPDQFTGRRVQLPAPDGATRPSDCEAVEVINTLDGCHSVAEPESSAFTQKGRVYP